jgi:ribosomal peptide maturation radical SAM protein 1
MQTDIVLCSAPVMSVVRPSVGIGVLHAALAARLYRVETLHLNLDFANAVGIDLNEQLAERTPAHLLIGDWLFANCVGQPGPALAVARHEREIADLLARRAIGGVPQLRDTVAPSFVAAAAEKILARHPRIVGFGTMFQQTMASLAIAKAIKAVDPSIVVVFGGANCHGPMGGALLRTYSQIDRVFTGEADTAFPDFADALLRGIGDADAVAGQLYRNGGVADAPPLRALDRVPIPDYTDYFAQLATLDEANRIVPSLPFESSRGCWWGQKHHCTFCGLNAEGIVFRAKSSQRVLDEMAELSARHGIGRFTATDNILAPAHLEGVMRPLAETPVADRSLFYEIKANLNEAQTALLADAGVTQVQPGIESLSDDTLAIMRKGVDRLLNLRLMRNCREFGIGVIWSILHGFPGEPAEAYDAMAELVPLIEHLPPPTGLSALRLDRFSPNYENAERLGFRDVRPAIAYSALHDAPPEVIVDLAYFFEGHAHGSATESDLARLRAAVAQWKARWRAPHPPGLVFVRIERGMLVKDTRTLAASELHYIQPVAAALVDRLRNPAHLAEAVEAVAAEHGNNAAERAARLLRDRHFIVVQGEKALSLLVDGGRCRAQTRGEDPFGTVAQHPVISKAAGAVS